MDLARLRHLVEEGCSTREIAAATGRSQTTVRYWLRAQGLKTTARAGRARLPRETNLCAVHGETPFVMRETGPQCVRCRADAVTRWRRRAKATLVSEAGGGCILCGYARYIGALQFHHLDPETKRFALGGRGLARAIDDLRSEAAKCVLLCANCHAEVEAGVTRLPFASALGRDSRG